MVKITRKTTESKMEVILENGPVLADYRKNITTPLPFLSHMIEHICWRSGFNLKTAVTTAEFYLTHVITEDLGLTVGKAFSEYIKKNAANGVYGYGDATAIIDEARATAAISFESRARFDFDTTPIIPTNVEGMPSEDLITFLDGFAQGACCTLHIELRKGENAHHIWEAIFRAFGIALGRACEINPSRVGMTSGVAGKIEFEVE